MASHAHNEYIAVDALLDSFCDIFSGLLPVRDRSTSSDEVERLESRLLQTTNTIRSDYNALQSINKLPDHVLETVFWFSQDILPSFMPIQPPGYESSRWTFLRLVCRRWRDVVASSTKLWSIISTSAAPYTFLERSGTDSLLIVHWTTRKDFKPLSLPMNLPWSRIREFHLDLSPYNDQFQHVFQCLSSTAPALESLTINSMGWQTWSATNQLPPLFGDQMPRLQQLSLEHFTSWPDGYFRGLTHVCLHRQPDESRVTTTVFLDFLEGCPELEELVLSKAGPTLTEEPPVPAGRVVSLPRLTEFSWGYLLHFSSARRLLSHLSLPSNTRLYFWDFPSSADAPFSSLLPADITRLPSVKNTKEWRITCFSPIEGMMVTCRFMAFVSGVMYTLGLTFESQIQDIVRAYADLLLRNITILGIVDDIGFSADAWRQVFTAVPNLTSLWLQPPLAWPSSRNILTPLYDGLHSDRPSLVLRLSLALRLNLARRPVCPNLTRLTLFGDPMHHTFLLNQIAKARKKRGSPLIHLNIHCSRREPGSCEAHLNAVDSREMLQRWIKYVTFSCDGGCYTLTVMAGCEGWPTKGFQWTQS